MARKLILKQNNKVISCGSFLCKDGCIVYKIVRKPEANFFLEYQEEDNVYVLTCNKSVSLGDIEEYVKNNYEWVLNQWRKIDNPDPWIILGKQVPVKTVIGAEHKVEYKDNSITVYIQYKKQFRDTAKSFLKEIATEYLQKRVKEVLSSFEQQASSISIKWYRTVWGLCSRDKELFFNARIIQFNPKYIDAIILHEMTHFAYMNHSKKFHDLLEKYVPNHRKLDREMNSWYFNNHLW